MVVSLFNKGAGFYDEKIPTNSKKRCFYLRACRFNQKYCSIKTNRNIDLTVNSKLQLEFSLDGKIFKSIESSL